MTETASSPPSLTPNVTRPTSEFVQAITLTDATMLVAGSMIGSGIFITSAAMARTVRSPLWLLAAWVLTGVITLLGALTYGELAAMFPRAGGQYVFLRESMGPLWAFCMGGRCSSSFRPARSPRSRSRLADSSACSGRRSAPICYGWFPQGQRLRAWLGCAEPANAIQLGFSPQRLSRW